MIYLTVNQITEHSGKHRVSVLNALKAAGVKLIKKKGVRGARITLKDANDFLRLQWPEVGAYREPTFNPCNQTKPE